MKRTRVELACGVLVIIIALSVAISGFILTEGQYVPVTNEYSIYEIAVHPPVNDYHYPLANYSLVRSGSVIELFDKVGITEFQAGIEFYQGVTNLSHKDDFGYLEIHETPSTVVEFEALQDNGMRFQLAQETGAVRMGQAIVVGSQDASGEFVMKGASTASIGDGDVVFDIPAGSGIIFRTDPVNDYAIGSAVANGRVAAEMYLYEAGWETGEDVVSFHDVELYAVTTGSEVVDIQALGTAERKALVIHVERPFLDYASSDDIIVHLDGQEIEAGRGMTETLTETGEEAVYYIQRTDTGFDIIVYIPQYSDNVITIASAEAVIGVDGLATLLAAIGIVGVAVAALIKTD